MSQSERAMLAVNSPGTRLDFIIDDLRIDELLVSGRKTQAGRKVYFWLNLNA